MDATSGHSERLLRDGISSGYGGVFIFMDTAFFILLGKPLNREKGLKTAEGNESSFGLHKGPFHGLTDPPKIDYSLRPLCTSHRSIGPGRPSR